MREGNLGWKVEGDMGITVDRRLAGLVGLSSFHSISSAATPGGETPRILGGLLPDLMYTWHIWRAEVVDPQGCWAAPPRYCLQNKHLFPSLLKKDLASSTSGLSPGQWATLLQGQLSSWGSPPTKPGHCGGTEVLCLYPSSASHLKAISDTKYVSCRVGGDLVGLHLNSTPPSAQFWFPPLHSQNWSNHDSLINFLTLHPCLLGCFPVHPTYAQGW